VRPLTLDACCALRARPDPTYDSASNIDRRAPCYDLSSADQGELAHLVESVCRLSA
jgi:hypothetical protein